MKENLTTEILKLWKQQNYDEASEIILRLDTPVAIKNIAQKINLNLLTGQALAHVLERLSLKEWGLNETLKLNQNNTSIITPLLYKKYQDEFSLANLDTKIKMFKEVRDNYTVLWENANDFLTKNWQHLVHLIGNLETGLKVHEALFMPSPVNLWSTVAALKTLEVSCNNKTVTEVENLYAILINNFKIDLSNPIRVRLAEIILQKMEG